MRDVKADRRDVRGSLGALGFIAFGVVCWLALRGIPNTQAVVFPRTVIGLMVTLCLILLVRNLIGRSKPESVEPGGSVIRRVALLAAMIVATWLMPYIGFVLAALAAYVATMAIAMYERWTPGRLVLYPISGVVVVMGFFFVFKYLFQVPLPEPAWFSMPF